MAKSENIDVISGEDYVSPLAGNERYQLHLAAEKVVFDLCEDVALKIEESDLPLEEILRRAGVSKKRYKKFMNLETADVRVAVSILHVLGFEYYSRLRVISSDG